MLIAEWSMDQLSQVSLGTGLIVIIAACVLICLLRGVFRLIINTVVVAAAGLAAYYAWRQAPVWVHDGLGTELPWVSTAAPIAAFIITWLALKQTLNLLLNPFSSGSSHGSGGPGKWVMLLISLGVAAILCLGGASMLHRAGALAEVENYAKEMGAESETFQNQLLAKMKETISQHLPDSLLGAIDPKSDQARLTLAKLLIANSDQKEKEIPRALPVMNKPEIRNLILKDPHLRQLAKQKRYAEILKDPRLDHVLENEELKELLKGLKL
jgi:hypothetical protein